MPSTGRWSSITALVLAVLALTACGQTPSAPSVPNPSSSAALPASVTVTRTGGIAGMNQEVTIQPGGSWSYDDKRAGKTENGQLSPDQYAKLVSLVNDPALAREATDKGDGVCADGFIYTITAGATRVMFDDCGNQDEKPTIQELITLVTSSTAL